MTGGSQQLRLFRRAIRDGVPIDAAAASAGIEIGEARLIIADDTRSPPPAEAYMLIGLSETLVQLCGPWGRCA